MIKANEKANEKANGNRGVGVTDEHVLGASIAEALCHNRYVLVELDENHFPVVTVVPASMSAAVNMLKYGSV